MTIYYSELESEKSDDPGGGAGETNNTIATTLANTGANMVQVGGGGGATAVAASLMRERLENFSTQAQIEEIQSNMWSRPNATAAAATAAALTQQQHQANNEPNNGNEGSGLVSGESRVSRSTQFPHRKHLFPILCVGRELRVKLLLRLYI